VLDDNEFMLTRINRHAPAIVVAKAPPSLTVSVVAVRLKDDALVATATAVVLVTSM
jgi:sarcosine oxidase gamma subunit